MAKKAILDVLENTIGRYVLNLDAHSLNVAVWSGKIELNSLELDTVSINNELDKQAYESPNLAMPVRVIGGHFDHLEVDVPWTKLTSKPVVFRARGLKIVISPHDNSSISSQSANNANKKKNESDQANKNPRKQMIEAAEESRCRSNALKELADDGESEDDSSFVSRLVRRVVENLQVDIENIQVSLKGCGASAGVELKSLSLVTTDENGVRTFVDRASGKEFFLHKALNISGFGIYLDELYEHYNESKSSKSGKSGKQKHSYILSPLSFQAALRQSNAVRCITFPKYLVTSELSNMSIKMSRTQLELMNRISQLMQPPKGVLRPLFPEYRPLVPIRKGTAKLWWKYAVRCIGRLTRKRSWSEFILAHLKQKNYIPLYKKVKFSDKCSWIKPITKQEQRLLLSIEMDNSISVMGIMGWRNMAEAQVKKERSKYENARAMLSPPKPTGYRAFFKSQENDSTSESDLDSIPIKLSLEEMRELQAMNLEEIADSILSLDSKLYDFKFELHSFKVDLIKSDLQPIATFEMGQMISNFLANNDGSYNFSFTISSMQVDDMITNDSLFPSIVQSLQSPTSATHKHAFEFQLKKAKDGDQDIVVKLVAFELVASPQILKEVKQFFTLTKNQLESQMNANPILQESMSGSTDLFYDALDDSVINEPQSSLINDTAAAAAKATSKMSDKLSNALSEAWNEKKVRKRTWTMDCDIHAPIIVIPEDVKDASGTVLVFDMGRLRIKLGNSPASTEVKRWFENRTEIHRIATEVDHWNLEMSDLTFLIGKAGFMDWKLQSGHQFMRQSSQAIIEPLSISLSAGIESSVTDFPLTCIHGVLPSICVQVSLKQVSECLAVVNKWKKVANELSGTNVTNSSSTFSSTYVGNDIILEEPELEKAVEKTKISDYLEVKPAIIASPSKSVSRPISSKIDGKEKSKDYFHFSLALRKLSAKFETNDIGNLEANLVSVVFSTTNFVDKSKSIRLCMGWFWILDGLRSNFPREQRLLAHSALPQPSLLYAIDEKYLIMDDLERHGAFDENYAGSSDLADISILQKPSKKLIENENDHIQDVYFDSIINAQFSSLFIHWNPQAIKNLLNVQSLITNSIKSSSDDKTAIADSLIKQKTNRRPSMISVSSNVQTNFSTSTTIKASMKKIELSLNSAKDDMPLFILTMANSKLDVHSTDIEGGNMEVQFGVGNIRIQTPSGRTNTNYNTIIGLAPKQASSLLSVNYLKGKQAIAKGILSNADKNKYEAYAEVELSPMRVVYIQSQIMALVEFVTEGVLGAMAAQVASSAKAAAIEVANATYGQQLYQIKASGIDLVIPQAANLENNIILHAGALVLWYRTLPDNGGGEAKISMGNVSVQSNNKDQIVEDPIRMSIDVSLPPPDAPTIVDRAMRINVHFSKAQFFLSHAQYAQIMHTLAMNFGEADTFLRAQVDVYGGDDSKQRNIDKETNAIHDGANPVQVKGGVLTHAGVSSVIIQKRMYFTFSFVEMAVELVGDSKSDPILHIAALQTRILIQLLPDQEKMIIGVTLHNLNIEDSRLISADRHFRCLMSQIEDHQKDAFHLTYISSYDGSSSCDVVVGSPQFVVLPDVINDVLEFLQIERAKSETIKNYDVDSNPEGADPDLKKEDSVNIYTYDYSDDVETSLEDHDSKSKIDIVTKYSLKTSNCRLVLVDIGSETMTDRKAQKKSSLKDFKQLTETVVFQGKVDASMINNVNSISKTSVGNKIQFQAEQMQLYTAEGKNLSSPVQIVEPADFTLFLTKAVDKNGDEEIELKAVSLTSIDMTISIRNVALFNAILSSINDSLLASKQGENMNESFQLSNEEAYKLERLSSDLNKTDDWTSDDSTVTRELRSESSTISVRSSYTDLLSLGVSPQKITRINTTVPQIIITITNDLQGLDQALFKIVASNVVCGTEIKYPVSEVKYLTFDSHLNASLLADYFDISTNLWMKFFREPWELTLSAKRSKGNKFKSNRFTTLLDIESHPCYISFSEQFLVGIGAAKQMWSMYSTAMTNASAEQEKDKNDSLGTDQIRESSIRKSLAANAARALVTTMPYGINNHTGLTVEFSLNTEKDVAHQERRSCPTGDIKYFRFENPCVKGIGGKRVYGQDVKHPRTLNIFIGTKILRFEHIDSEVNRPRHAHELDKGQFIFTYIVNTGRATILHLNSHMHVYNNTNIPFSIALQSNDNINDIGVCHGKARSKMSGRKRAKLSSHRRKNHDGMMSTKYQSSLGIPSNLLQDFVIDAQGNSDFTALDLLFCPHVSDKNFDCEKDKPPVASASLVGKKGSFRWGVLSLPPIHSLVQIATGKKKVESIEVMCSMPSDEMHLRAVGHSMHKNQKDSICIQISVKITLVDQAHPFVEVYIQPRAILENKLPISLFVRTSMPFTFSPPNDKGICFQSIFDLHDHVTHRLDPHQSIEIFSPGPSVSITAMCADGPVAGGVTGWSEGPADIPLGIGRQLLNPIQCLFPFIGRDGEFIATGGSPFYIMESDAELSGNSTNDSNKNQEFALRIPEDNIRSVKITVPNFIVDHTGKNLFELNEKNAIQSGFEKRNRRLAKKKLEKPFLPWSAFASIQKGRRITLLPESSKPIHLVELTMNEQDGLNRSIPFKVDDISICEGGVESSTIIWENNLASGYYAYRQLRSFGQSEVHIIPEFVAFNGSTKNTIVIKQPQSNHIVLGPEKIAPLTHDNNRSLIIMVEILDLSGSISPIQVDQLGMRMCVVKSNATGNALGSLAIQTVVGGKDSRLVIKIGAVSFGGKERINEGALNTKQNVNIISDDFLRFRVRWTELKISLSDTKLEDDNKIVPQKSQSDKLISPLKQTDLVVIEIVFHRFTVDFQRVFKDEDSVTKRIQSPERSQLAVVIHNMRILDCVPNSKHPIVFDGFTNQSVFDLCLRFRGPVNAELVKVELFDINLAYSKDRKVNRIVLNASEVFIWRLLDVLNRIMTAINDLAGHEIVLDWNDKANEFEVSIIESTDEDYYDDSNEVKYQAPRSDKMYNVKTARVSPIFLLFSFQREPQASRYFKRAGKAPGAKLMNYFTHRLKFTIQNADLKFPGYITRNIKGPSDRLIDNVTTFYISRIKLQFMTLMSAVSLQDWKYLTNRESGDDEFVEGDILRLTGNMAGRSVGYVIKKVGEGLGDGVSTLTTSIGNEFEKTTEFIGAGAVGARVNSLVSGVGDGVGNTVKGVGLGAGNIIRGAGRGVGQIAGGLGGGVQQVAKGHFKEGAVAIGEGVGKGLETTVSGVADGVVNVSQGLFSGVRSIGTGIGGVFTGKKHASQYKKKPPR